MQATKAKVLKSLDEQLSIRFKHFFEKAGSLFDKLLIACMQYLVALLYLKGLRQAFSKAQRQKHERLKADLVEEKLADLQKWVCVVSLVLREEEDIFGFSSMFLRICLAFPSCSSSSVANDFHRQIDLSCQEKNNYWVEITSFRLGQVE